MKQLPPEFKPLFWSYNFDELDTTKHQKTIILNTIKYGDLWHWRWLQNNYGAKIVQEVLEKTKKTELRPSVFRLANLLFAYAS